MSSKILDGKKLADDIRSRIAADVALLVKKGIKPGLAVVLTGDDPASRTYVKMKRAQCEKTGIASFDHDLPPSTTEKELLALIAKLNTDRSVHGILVQLPLPEHINEERVIEAIDPAKDVDCFHPENVGRLFSGNARFVPCTPAGIMALIDSSGIDPAGKHAVVIGRSNIVGKPAALLLLTRNATVTICHSKTQGLADEVSRADIVVAAIGRPKMIKGEWIKPGACVIDVGINRTADGKLTGDVDFDSAKKRAGAITPVPGGVGPMTIAMLLKNTVNAAKESVDAKKNPSL